MGMMNLRQALDFISQSIPQARLVGDGATPLARVHTDTRTLQPGDLFVALKGERFDANAFLADARDAGAVAQQHADWVVVTSDNPRSEEPVAILHQILQGTIAGETVRAEPDRAAAIALAIGEADAADVVLIAGKGHEDYQETAGVRRPFDDMAQAQAALTARGASTWA